MAVGEFNAGWSGGSPAIALASHPGRTKTLEVASWHMQDPEYSQGITGPSSGKIPLRDMES